MGDVESPERNQADSTDNVQVIMLNIRFLWQQFFFSFLFFPGKTRGGEVICLPIFIT